MPEVQVMLGDRTVQVFVHRTVVQINNTFNFSGPEVFAGDGVTTLFETAHVFLIGSCQVFLNGILQGLDLDYTERSDHMAIIFNTPPDTDWRIELRYRYL